MGEMKRRHKLTSKYKKYANVTLRGHEAKFRIPHSKTEIHKKGFFPSEIHFWNIIPPHAPAADSPQAFRSTTEVWLRND